MQKKYSRDCTARIDIPPLNDIINYAFCNEGKSVQSSFRFCIGGAGEAKGVHAFQRQGRKGGQRKALLGVRHAKRTEGHSSRGFGGGGGSCSFAWQHRRVII